MNSATAFCMPFASGRVATAAVCLCALLGMAPPSYGETQNSDPVIAIVNGTQIHESDVAVVDQMMGHNIATVDPVERREAVMRILIDGMLLGQIAKERNIIDQADIDRRVTFARNEGLADNLLTVVSKNAVTEEAERKVYDDAVEKSAEPQVHLRQIFLHVVDARDGAAVKAAQAKAEVALKRLKNGEDFAAVYADVSDDRATVPNGGDQGWRVRGEVGNEIMDAALALKDGELSPVIKTAAGFHILKLEERRVRKPPTFEESKERLGLVVQNMARIDLIRKARESAKIERLDTVKASATKSN